MNRLNIGIFTETYKPTLNGVVFSIEAFRNQLKKLGHEVHIFAPTFRGYIDGSRIFRLPSIINPFAKDFPLALPWLDRKIRQEILALNLDIIHTQHPFAMGRFGLRISQTLNIPLVFTNHTQYEQYLGAYVPWAKAIGSWYLKGYLKRFCQKCDRVIAPAAGIKEILQNYGVSAEKITIIPNGIDTQHFSGQKTNFLKEKYQLAPDAVIAVYTGRLAREKNSQFLLEAFTKVIKETKAILILVGKGPLAGTIKTKVQKPPFAGRVIYVGPVPHTEINQYYLGADFFVTASLTEVHPLVVLEAMACGCPPVAIHAPGTGDIITSGKDGLLAKNNLSDFSETIVHIIKNKQLRDCLSHQAISTAKLYSIPNTTEKLLNLYKEVIEAKKSSTILLSK